MSAETSSTSITTTITTSTTIDTTTNTITTITTGTTTIDITTTIATSTIATTTTGIPNPPYVYNPNGTPTAGIPNPTYAYDPDTDPHGGEDDNWNSQVIPVAVSLYGFSSSTLWLSSNGIISLSGPDQYYPYGAGLPSSDIPDPDIPNDTAAPFWYDLVLDPGRGHGIWWSYVNGIVYVEYICTSFSDSSRYFHFQVEFPTATPNIVVYRYYEMNTNVYAFFGVQKDSTTGYGFPHSTGSPAQGWVVTCDTTTTPGICVRTA
ncbi:hypothetical protein H2200_003057 [Cladophialophora chaetospira]|uniref:Uncharacterized protein n=1 Tax=Cladophialophora chaetospira TaxID=386627 RepID=A0AA39CMB2_9EURO|nr:hypothetical protein H2200_003057 [Cladophialophora chaetospira]